MAGDPGSFDEEEFAASIARGRLDVDLLAARAFTGDVQAMCMYGDWLLHRAQVAQVEEDADPGLLAAEGHRWLERAMGLGSWQAAGMLGSRPREPRLRLVPTRIGHRGRR